MEELARDAHPVTEAKTVRLQRRESIEVLNGACLQASEQPGGY